MNPNIKEIIDFMIAQKNFENCRQLETEHFLYWIKYSSYKYDGYSVTRDEFNNIRNYATKHGTLPSVERERRAMSEEQKKNCVENMRQGYKNSDNPEVSTYTNSSEVILRYSKTYDQLEYYYYDVGVRSPFNAKHDKVIVMKKKRKIFSVNNKGYVLTSNNKWLSIKNWVKFHRTNPEVSENLAKLLLKSMIGKDWVLNLEDTSYMISNKSARKANSFQEAIIVECGVKPVKIIRKIFDDNDILNLYSVIEPNKIHYLTNLMVNNKEKVGTILENSYDKSNTLLYLYFISRDNRCDKSIVYDYIKMLKQVGKKINLNISSYNTIKANHDRLSREILSKKSLTKTKLKVNKIYPNIKSLPGLQVEKIKTVQRLNEESKILHHCVHSYKDSINRGFCAIYSLMFENELYTLELRAKEKKVESEEDKEFNAIFGETNEPIQKEKEYVFLINQLRGRFNCDPPIEMKPFLEKMCQDNNLLPLSESRVNFSQRAITKEEKKAQERVVKQIGEKIFDRMDNNGNVNRLYEGEENKPLEFVVENENNFEEIW